MVTVNVQVVGGCDGAVDVDTTRSNTRCKAGTSAARRDHAGACIHGAIGVVDRNVVRRQDARAGGGDVGSRRSDVNIASGGAHRSSDVDSLLVVDECGAIELDVARIGAQASTTHKHTITVGIVAVGDGTSQCDAATACGFDGIRTANLHTMIANHRTITDATCSRDRDGTIHR